MENEERFAAYLKRHKLRQTPERKAILRMASGLKAHFDADLLHSTLEKEGYHVSRATVYNTLEILCRCGILQRLFFASTHAHYELAGRDHLHLYCTTCGLIREIGEPLEPTERQRQRFSTFSADHISAVVYGTCRRCMKKQRAAARSIQKNTDTNNNNQ